MKLCVHFEWSLSLANHSNRVEGFVLVTVSPMDSKGKMNFWQLKTPFNSDSSNNQHKMEKRIYVTFKSIFSWMAWQLTNMNFQDFFLKFFFLFSMLLCLVFFFFTSSCSNTSYQILLSWSSAAKISRLNYNFILWYLLILIAPFSYAQFILFLLPWISAIRTFLS